MIKVIEVMKEIIIADEIYEVKYTLREYSQIGKEAQRQYGYRVEEYLYTESGDARKLIDMVETPAVFDDYDIAEEFYQKMINEDVFPQTLCDHIDDWYCAFHPSQQIG